MVNLQKKNYAQHIHWTKNKEKKQNKYYITHKLSSEAVNK